MNQNATSPGLRHLRDPHRQSTVDGKRLAREIVVRHEFEYDARDLLRRAFAMQRDTLLEIQRVLRGRHCGVKIRPDHPRCDTIHADVVVGELPRQRPRELRDRGPGAGRPKYQWTRKVQGKTVSVALSQEQFEWLRTAIENWRTMQSLLREMQILSRQVLFTNNPESRRRKRLSKRAMGLIYVPFRSDP